MQGVVHMERIAVHMQGIMHVGRIVYVCGIIMVVTPFSAAVNRSVVEALRGVVQHGE